MEAAIHDADSFRQLQTRAGGRGCSGAPHGLLPMVGRVLATSRPGWHVVRADLYLHPPSAAEMAGVPP